MYAIKSATQQSPSFATVQQLQHWLADGWDLPYVNCNTVAELELWLKNNEAFSCAVLIL